MNDSIRARYEEVASYHPPPSSLQLVLVSRPERGQLNVRLNVSDEYDDQFGEQEANWIWLSF